MKSRLEALAEVGMIIAGSIVFGAVILLTVVGGMMRLDGDHERP